MRHRTGEPGLCPVVTAAFELLGRKWTGLVMKILIQNDMQFSDLLREIPCISARMLTVRLKELEDVGLVERTVSATMPVRVHYSLTGKGRGLTSVLDGIASWAHEWSPVGSVDAVSESADAED